MARFILTLSLLLSLTAAFAADTVYVVSAKAKMFATPAFDAQVVVVANKGDALSVVEKSGDWLKVASPQHTGWVSALVVGNKPPEGKVTVIRDKEGDAQKEDVRRRASSSASAAAARGLRQDDRARANENNQANYPAVEKMEATKVDEKEVETFVKGAGK